MRPNVMKQADDYLSPKVLRYIGGIRTYAQRANFFLAVPNTLMIAVLFYGDNSLVQSIFPTVYHWVAFLLFVAIPSAILADRVLLHPAQIAYNSHQQSRENRNPSYRLVEENNRMLQEMQDDDH